MSPLSASPSLLATRARSIIATSSHVEIGTLCGSVFVHRHLVDPSGDILLNPHTDAQPWVSPLLEGKASGIFHLAASDVTTVPQPDRLRGVLTL